MSKTLYVGNLSYRCSDADLFQHFSSVGQVISARIVMDRESGRSRGFGFVEMGTENDMHSAIEHLHEKPFMGRNLAVNEARPRDNDRGGFGGPRPHRSPRQEMRG